MAIGGGVVEIETARSVETRRKSLFWRSSVTAVKSRSQFRSAIVSAVLGSMVIAPMAQAFEIDKELGGAVIGAIIGAATGRL